MKTDNQDSKKNNNKLLKLLRNDKIENSAIIEFLEKIG